MAEDIEQGSSLSKASHKGRELAETLVGVASYLLKGVTCLVVRLASYSRFIGDLVMITADEAKKLVADYEVYIESGIATHSKEHFDRTVNRLNNLIIEQAKMGNTCAGIDFDEAQVPSGYKEHYEKLGFKTTSYGCTKITNTGFYVEWK